MGLEVGTGSTSLSLEMAIGMVLLCPARKGPGREGRGGGENSLEALEEVAVVDVAAAVVMILISGSLGQLRMGPKGFQGSFVGIRGGFVSS